MRRSVAAVVIGIAVGTALVAGAAGTGRAPAASSAAPPTGAAVFASDLGIYVANLDGTGLKRLTPSGYDADPVWSPDAKRIAFSRFAGGLDDAVMVMTANGSGLRRVGSGERPAWSPDGTRIAVTGQTGVREGETGRVLRPGLAGFWILRPDGTAPRRVETGSITGNLTWSPDGTRIAFVVDGSVCAYDLVSKKVARLAPVSPGTSFVAWSPNGKEIALGAGEVYEDDADLAVVDVATRRVSKLADKARAPVWSPDGTRIAFWRPGQLLMIGRDGRGRRRVESAANGREDSTVSWSGDGRSLLFSKRRSAGVGSDIWWGRADGREAGRITTAFPTGASFSAPQWAVTRVPTRPARSARAISLEPARVLATPSKVVELAAGEGWAAVETETTSGCPLSIWDASGTLHRVAGGYCRTEVAVAGRRVAWVVFNGELFDRDLEIATRDTKPTSVDYAPEKYDYDMLGHLAGDGDLLVYNKWRAAHSGDILDPRWHPVDMSLWRIDGAKPTKVADGADAFPVADVDAGRVAVLREDGKLVVLDRAGKRLSTFRLGRKGMEPEQQDEVSEPRWPVRLSGPVVVALRGRTIEVRAAASGAVRHRWPTVPSEAPATLEDARGAFAVYKAGIALHLLRLSDGRDRMIEIAGAEGPVHAELERDGLYFSYNTPAGAKPGRVAFVPLRELTVRFR